MPFTTFLLSSFSTVGLIVAATVIVAAIETLIPLRALGPAARAHLAPNLALTLITFGLNTFFNAGLVFGLMWLETRDAGLLPWLNVPTWLAVVIVVLGLDFAFYVAHVLMHKTAVLWRCHRVHHSDPAVDVTTTIRQHPIEGALRYTFMAGAAFLLGASPAAFAVYRVLSALNGLLEHANIRVPRRLDRVVSYVFATPNLHKVHHSRQVEETDSNYGNIFAIFDRLFATFTPSERGLDVVYGLDNVEDAAARTTSALLALPFRVQR